jgi:hypothetical protein
LDITQNYHPQSGLELALQRPLSRPRRAIKNPALAIEGANEVEFSANRLFRKITINQWLGLDFGFPAESRCRHPAQGGAY